MSDVQDSLHGLLWVRRVLIVIREVPVQSHLPSDRWVLQLYKTNTYSPNQKINTSKYICGFSIDCETKTQTVLYKNTRLNSSLFKQQLSNVSSLQCKYKVLIFTKYTPYLDLDTFPDKVLDYILTFPCRWRLFLMISLTSSSVSFCWQSKRTVYEEIKINLQMGLTTWLWG